MSSVLTNIEDELSRHGISPRQSSEAQSSKEFKVVVDLEALADLEFRANARHDYNGGAQSCSKETLIAESEQLCRSIASGLRIDQPPPAPRGTALVADVSRAADPAECGPTRSVPPTWYRRIPVRVAAYLAVLGLIFVGFIPFVTHAGADSSHRTPAPPALKQSKANDARRPSKTDSGPTASRPAEARSGRGRGPFRAEIKAINTSWISAAADGKESVDKVLRKDETSEVEFSAVVLLTIGNAGGVEISLEGKPIGPIGPDDVPRLIELTPSGFRFLRLSKKQAL